MILHKNMKNAKIMEEIFAYLLEKKYVSIDASLRIKDDETTFIVTVQTDSDTLLQAFKREMICCRDIELEEYGWELMGESECVCELDTLGMLVDSYDITYEQGICTIVLHRKG